MVKLISIVHEVRIPTSPPAASLIDNTQPPFGTEYNPEKTVTFEVYPTEAVIAVPAEGANVPVNGATPAPMPVTPVELITVLVKLSPEPPTWLIKFRIFPLGAFKLKIMSASHVCVMFIVTATAVIVAPAGTAVTFKVLVIPVGSES